MATGRDDSVTGPSSTEQLRGRADLRRVWRQVRGSSVLGSGLGLSLVGALTFAAPEAVARAYAAQHSTATLWGDLLVAAPILGLAVGLLLIRRLPAQDRSALVLRFALLAPLPLLATIVQPPLPVVWVAWFACGAFQCYQLPLHLALARLVTRAVRRRFLGLAAILWVGACGVGLLGAGWVSEHTTPAASVGIFAVVTLGLGVLLAPRWPTDPAAHERATGG